LGNLRSNGRLSHSAVERAIADGHAEKDSAGRGKGIGAKGRECVYVKATGRAIPRALEVGVYFQGERDCRVKVELGSVRAVDDIEVIDEEVGDRGGEGGEEEEEGDVEMVGAVDPDAGDEDGEKADSGKGKQQNKKRRRKEMAQEDIPETRVRTLSSVTVSIWLL
jgi:ribonuclease P/MRP protein subunit POP7